MCEQKQNLYHMRAVSIIRQKGYTCIKVNGLQGSATHVTFVGGQGPAEGWGSMRRFISSVGVSPQGVRPAP